MSKIIFLATHPRSCSTAFERVMMTRSEDALVCIHEPFGDAFYYGPERIGERYFGDSGSEARAKSGFGEVTFGDVVDMIERERESAEKEGKRVFIKDILHYLLPPNPAKNPAEIPPSLRLGIHKRKGYGTDGVKINGFTNGTTNDANGRIGTNGYTKDEDIGNPTVLPLRILKTYQFTFLIRHPRRAIPSYYRCCIPPLSDDTGFDHFLPSEAGYRELRTFFDYVREKGLVTDKNLCMIDADDLLDKPKEVVQKYCESVGLDFKESMLGWGEDAEGCGKFDKWKGFHNDAIESVGLKPREQKKERTEEEEYKGWVEKYGVEGAELIRGTVKANVDDYEYLKQFKMDI